MRRRKYSVLLLLYLHLIQHLRNRLRGTVQQFLDELHARTGMAITLLAGSDTAHDDRGGKLVVSVLFFLHLPLCASDKCFVAFTQAALHNLGRIQWGMTCLKRMSPVPICNTPASRAVSYNSYPYTSAVQCLDNRGS